MITHTIQHRAYEKSKADVLDSEFRSNLFGKQIRPVKPAVRRVKGENEFSDERSTSHAIVYVKGEFADGRKFNIPETDFVIYETDNGIAQIGRLTELKKRGILQDITKLQKLDEVAEGLKSFIDRQVEKEDQHEKTIREAQYKQGKITEEERDSAVILWKILH